MGFKTRSSQITKNRKHALVAMIVATSAFLRAGAADKEPEATPTPTPEPTERPRPDILNIKKSSASDELLKRDWMRLSLLKASDLPGLKQIPEAADQSLRKRISDGFGLPAVMTIKEPLRSPPQWWTPEVRGMAALTLGPTRHFARPELKIEVPMLRLREIPFLNGETDFVRSMNEIVRLWTLGRVHQAAKLRSELQKAKKQIPRGTKERTAIAIMNGFLDLQEAANVAEPLEFYGPSLGSLWDALGSTELNVFMNPQGGNHIDLQLFHAALAEPALFSRSGIYPPVLSAPRIKPRSMDIDLFVRTLALPALFNVASLAAQAGNWTRVYEASQKFERIYALLDKSHTHQDGKNLTFTTPSGVAVTHPMLMQPQTAHQLHVIMKMLQVRAQFLAEDPLLALRETAKVILASDVPAFRTIGFSFAGNIYDDLGYPDYARRFYAFAEAFADVEWYQQNPYFLLRGAENAFWAGDYEIAKAGFEKFLLAAGDKNFGPWARLRLAEMTHLKSGAEKASVQYEELFRNHPGHPAGIAARRRLFCISAPQLGARARYIEYQSLKEMFPKMELDEIEQVRACHISGLFDDAAKVSQKTIKSLPDEAKVQLDLIAEFKQKYPLSAYLKFFETRRVTLEAAMGPYLLAFKQCQPALDFVKKNEEKISVLKSKSGQFLESLKWTQEEQERLTRCAALFSSNETLDKIFSGSAARPLGKDKKKSSRQQKSLAGEAPEKRLTRLTVEMTTRPEDKKASELFVELRRRGKKSFAEDVKELEKQEAQSIDDNDFWSKLATLRVMQWDLEQPAGKKPALNRLMRAEVLRSPDQTIKFKEFCERFLLESSTMNRKEWDQFVLAIPTSRWLELAGASTPPPKEPSISNSDSCEAKVADDALKASQSLPSLARDRHLLWPWLQARGAQKESEAWLALGQRWDQQGSVSKQELENLFKTLEKEADSPTVKQAAKAWRESRKPSGLW
ncbi:MAG: tetratricopeptide repeat protein [Silvanigrellaceae bacterium]